MTNLKQSTVLSPPIVMRGVTVAQMHKEAATRSISDPDGGRLIDSIAKSISTRPGFDQAKAWSISVHISGGGGGPKHTQPL